MEDSGTEAPTLPETDSGVKAGFDHHYPLDDDDQTASERTPEVASSSSPLNELAVEAPRRKLGVPEGAISSSDAKLVEAVREAKSGSRTLNLSRFGLVHIPKGHMDGLQHLQYLFLTNNQIMELPPALFFKLPCLKWLDMRENRLRHIPSEVGQHNSLEVVLLDGNLISHLPFQIAEVPSLRQVTLKKNPWEFPPAGVVAEGWKVVQKFLKDVNAGSSPSESRGAESKEELNSSKNLRKGRARTEAQSANSASTCDELSLLRDIRDVGYWMAQLDEESASSARPGYALPNEQDLHRNHQRDIALAKKRREAEKIDKELQKTRDAEFIKQWRGRAAFEQRQFAVDYQRRQNDEGISVNGGIECPFGTWQEADLIPDRSTYNQQKLQPLPTAEDEKRRVIALNQKTEGIVHYMKGVFEEDLNNLMNKLASLEHGSAPSGADAILESQQLLSEIAKLQRKLGGLSVIDARKAGDVGS